MRYALLVTLPLYGLDQLTKLLVERALPFGSFVPVVPGLFNLVHVGNTGAAFSLGQGNNWFFVALSLAVLVSLVVLAWRGGFHDGWTRMGAALVAAGILGNVTDRIARGHVVDFLDFHWRGHHWPAFNVADSCICVAAALFVISSFRQKSAAAPEANGG
jgi:signal peptidase II